MKAIAWKTISMGSLIFFFVTAIMLLSGCLVTNRSYVGESSWETKKNLRRSLMLVMPEALYPSGPEDNVLDGPQRLPREKVQQIHAELQRVLTQIVRRHNARYEALSRFYTSPLSQLPDFRMRLTNSGAPLIHSDVSGDFVVDLRVLRALFLATLVVGLPNSWDPKNPMTLGDFTSIPNPINRDRIHDALVRFLEFRSLVERTGGYPALVDFFRWGIFGESDMSLYASAFAQLEEGFLGALVFLLSHEVGHNALRHFSAPVTDQATFSAMEVNADISAAILIADSWGEDRLFGEQETVTESMRGNTLYFGLAEHLVGFRRN